MNITYGDCLSPLLSLCKIVSECKACFHLTESCNRIKQKLGYIIYRVLIFFLFIVWRYFKKYISFNHKALLLHALRTESGPVDYVIQ
jgi:hypothetical protein